MSRRNCEFCGEPLDTRCVGRTCGDCIDAGAGCRDCADATGGVCRSHQQTECTCYEPGFGHEPGCAFNRSRR